ncbi:hypothetical protein [Sphingomonas xanthus]|uniref:Uncharacterized protein n=1 Tax=Sphingomonas xanthus TaxID=2594473 RepID=A0A516IQT3_9SPHN|nr:hypothetical protein [Sphingomonas xanthus]QDP19266.1 hypothetical protein FMM02_04375 [Sphingomonas xanthus]
MSKAPSSSPLARIAQRIRAHDWFAAAIEVAIVVLGIFLGLQVTQWNEERQDRAREISLMMNVARNLREDVAEMDENIRTASSRMASLDYLLRLAGDWDPPREFPSSRFAIQVEQVPPFNRQSGYAIGIEAFILSFYDGNRFAYNTLINADGPNLIDDQMMLGEIQQYYASVDLLLTFERSLAENRLRILDAMQKEGISAVDGKSFQEVASIVRANPPLRAAVENYWLYANRQVYLTRRASADAADLADRIERKYRN